QTLPTVLAMARVRRQVCARHVGAVRIGARVDMACGARTVVQYKPSARERNRADHIQSALRLSIISNSISMSSPGFSLLPLASLIASATPVPEGHGRSASAPAAKGM